MPKIIHFLFFLLIFSACEKKEIDFKINETISRQIILDQSYGAHTQQKMDVYLPVNRNDQTPMIVLLHGGAWFGGDKSEVNEYLKLIQTKWPEVAICNLNYRLADNVSIHYKEQAEDIKKAIDYIKSKQSDYGISPKIAIAGVSSGAQLAMQYAYNDSIQKDIRCVADLYGPTMLYDTHWYNSYISFGNWHVKDALAKYNNVALEKDSLLYYSNSPIENSHKNYVPTIIFHGTSDPIVPFYHGVQLAERLKKYELVHEFHPYNNELHGFNANNNDDCVNKLVTFFKKYLTLNV